MMYVPNPRERERESHYQSKKRRSRLWRRSLKSKTRSSRTRGREFQRRATKMRDY
jgi:hypothetical protein